MAHYCPECGRVCHCHGDIDDIAFGERADCTCCPPEDEDDEPEELAEYYEEEDE